MDIRDLLKEKILVLDGAMGTMIQRYKLQEEDFRGDRFKDHSHSLKGNNDLIGLTRPDVLEAIHRAYFEAGADIIETNTFSGTTIAQADYGLEDAVYDINFSSAKIARKVADEFTLKEPHKPRFVAGSIGPTNKTASISPDVNDPGYRATSFDELKIAFKEQAIALIDGDVDMLLVETAIDTLNVKAALVGIQEAFDEKGKEIPIMVSGSIVDQSGRTLSGQTTEAFLISISHMPLLSVGLNCSLGAKDLLPYVQVLANKADVHVSSHPNAGLPNEFGEYDQTPKQMQAELKTFLDLNLVNIVGGCCGTTPDHIKAIVELTQDYKPRKINTHETETV